MALGSREMFNLFPVALIIPYGFLKVYVLSVSRNYILNIVRVFSARRRGRINKSKALHFSFMKSNRLILTSSIVLLLFVGAIDYVTGTRI